MDAHLVPLLGQMAVTMGNDAAWKTLNHKVLMKTRASHAAVRLGDAQERVRTRASATEQACGVRPCRGWPGDRRA